MFASKLILTALVAASSVFAAPAELARRDLTVTTSTSGTYNGYYYQNYVEGSSGSTMVVGTGSFKLTWTTAAEDVVAGVGWQTGALR